MDYVQIGENFAASIEYLERLWEQRYGPWLLAQAEWVDGE